jgi:hypothetical protein
MLKPKNVEEQVLVQEQPMREEGLAKIHKLFIVILYFFSCRETHEVLDSLVF